MSVKNIRSGKVYILHPDFCIVGAMDQSQQDNTSVIEFRENKGDNQKWRLTNDAAQGWTFQNLQFSTYLAPDQYYTRVVGSNSPYYWDIVRIYDNSQYFQISLKNTSYYLTAGSGYGNPIRLVNSTSLPEAPVQRWAFWEH